MARFIARGGDSVHLMQQGWAASFRQKATITRGYQPRRAPSAMTIGRLSVVGKLVFQALDVERRGRQSQETALATLPYDESRRQCRDIKDLR